MPVAPRFRTIGQPAALELVSRVVADERPPHALLLVGPPHVGKHTLALDLAAGLLCLDQDAGRRPCRECAACRKVEHGNHPDLHLIAPEGAGQQIRLGQVQSLTAELALLPLEGRFRVAVIEQAHRLNQDAQNALLKTLEEPPARVCVVLAADESSNLLPTVLSRCARIRLGPVVGDELTDWLAQVAGIDRVRAVTLSRLADGRPGVALSLSAQPDVILIQGRLCRRLLDLLAADRRSRLAAAAELLEDGAALAFASAGSSGGRQKQTPAERRAAAAQVLAVWRDVARDVAVAAHGGSRELRQVELIGETVSVAETVPVAWVVRFLARLEALARALDGYANPELIVDVLLVEWPTVAGKRRGAAVPAA